jgi:hypothetical protein
MVREAGSAEPRPERHLDQERPRGEPPCSTTAAPRAVPARIPALGERSRALIAGSSRRAAHDALFYNAAPARTAERPAAEPSVCARQVPEKFLLKIVCVSCCQCVNTPQCSCLPSYQASYLDGPLANHNTFNITMVGDLLSGTGTYNNFADDSGNVACPAPFGFILTFDTNVALVSYGATFNTPCGNYTGDSGADSVAPTVAPHTS